MTFEAYTNPDFTIGQKFLFFIITFIGITICSLLVIMIQKLVFRLEIGKSATDSDNHKLFHRLQRLFEMIISGTSVMSFSVAYVVINHINSLYSAGQGHSDAALSNFIGLWTEGKDFILLLLILISCVLNTVLDSFIIPLKELDKSEKATMRMLGMFYVIIILIYLNMIGDSSQYGPVMMYYLGLMVGRFIYFDASFEDFWVNIKNVFINLPYLIMCLILTALLCMFGFGQGYFLERNYYIVDIYYVHLFMLICVFILNIGLLIYKAVKIPDNGIDDEGMEDNSFVGTHQAGNNPHHVNNRPVNNSQKRRHHPKDYDNHPRTNSYSKSNEQNNQLEDNNRQAISSRSKINSQMKTDNRKRLNSYPKTDSQLENNSPKEVNRLLKASDILYREEGNGYHNR